MSPVRLLRRHSRPDPLAAALALALVPGVLAGTAACRGGEQGAAVVRRDSAGVEIVDNPPAERTLEWSFHRAATLGGEMEGPESFTSVNPAGLDALRFAPDGLLWVVRGHVDGEEPAIDVFDPAGSYVGTLPPGSPVPLLFLPDGRLVAEETDELDVDRLVVYRLDRTAG